MDYTKLRDYLDRQKQAREAAPHDGPQIDKDEYQKFLAGSNGVFQGQPKDDEEKGARNARY